MFIGKIENLSFCNDLTDSDVNGILKFVKENDLLTITPGRYELNDGNYVNVFDFTPKPEGGNFESHRKYLDVQCILKGKEFMKWSNLKNCTPINEYNDDKDIINYTCDDKYCDSAVFEERCVVFNPIDAHAPGFAVGKPEEVRKAVFKIRVK